MTAMTAYAAAWATYWTVDLPLSPWRAAYWLARGWTA